jgi:glycine/D-amino acid oxidase-like deaminating enzyme/nitrite reductase/ring-hydroxylating ferredoxin subunit
MDLPDPAYEPRSLWTATSPRQRFPRLEESLTTDVCIVGGGIAGLSAAYLLTRAGRSVVVLDDGPLGGGATAATSAHLSTALDDRWVEIERLHGPDGARLAAASHAQAIDVIARIIAREGIECGFERVDGYLFQARGSDPADLEAELEAAHRAGLTGVTRVRRAPIPSYDTGPCLLFPGQAQFHPLRYVAGLAAAVRGAGGRLHTETHVDHIEGGDVACARAGRFEVRAKAVVVATNAPIQQGLDLHTKQSPFMTYVIAARVPRSALARALYWDTEDPYHYLRLVPAEEAAGNGGGDDWLLIGGEDHRTGQAEDTDERHARLEAWARARIPALRRVESRWSGQVMETIDGLAFIGPDPTGAPNVYVATGDSGMGLTHGTIAGILLAEQVEGRDHPWSRLYDPSRKSMRTVAAFARDAVAPAAVGGEPPGASSSSEIPPGSGAVRREGSELVAVYRDEAGERHEVSAVCTHRGCIVDWNDTEKTWDCPCHGSRFDRFGGVIQGPANEDLRPVELRTPERA